MTLGLLLQMGYQFLGDVAHEWVGAGMFLLFIAHHILNRGWYKALFRGRYTPWRIFQLSVDLLVFLSMIGLMVSGMMLSRHVFAFLPIRGGMSFARLLHMAASYWGFVLMALHLGLHWNMILGMARNLSGRKQPARGRTAALWAIAGCIALYGLYVFLSRDLPSYMFLQTEFVFFDFGESPLLFYLDYLAMMGLFIFLAHALSGLLRRLDAGKKKRGGR